MISVNYLNNSFVLDTDKGKKILPKKQLKMQSDSDTLMLNGCVISEENINAVGSPSEILNDIIDDTVKQPQIIVEYGENYYLLNGDYCEESYKFANDVEYIDWDIVYVNDRLNLYFHEVSRVITSMTINNMGEMFDLFLRENCVELNLGENIVASKGFIMCRVENPNCVINLATTDDETYNMIKDQNPDITVNRGVKIDCPSDKVIVKSKPKEEIYFEFAHSGSTLNNTIERYNYNGEKSIKISFGENNIITDKNFNNINIKKITFNDVVFGNNQHMNMWNCIEEVDFGNSTTNFNEIYFYSFKFVKYLKLSNSLIGGKLFKIRYSNIETLDLSGVIFPPYSSEWKMFEYLSFLKKIILGEITQSNYNTFMQWYNHFDDECKNKDITIEYTIVD